MKIAHISDLHICTRRNFRNIKKMRRLLKHISENNFDHVVITGDITENGLEKEFMLIRNLLEEFDLLRPDKLSVVIGNHDVYGGIQFVEDIAGFPGKCIKTNYKRKVMEFGEYFRETFDGVYSPGPDLFPYAKDLGEVVLIGINSISEYSRLKNFFASKGRISEEQASGLFRIFNSGKYSEKPAVVLIHHHLYKTPFYALSGESRLWAKIENEAMKLRGRKRLLNFLSRYDVKLILHGHVHESAGYLKKGIMCMNAGETFSTSRPGKISYNEVRIERANSIITKNIKLPDRKTLKSPYGFSEILATNSRRNDFHEAAGF
ncbi:MAG: metallophosphoesterase [Ignavibacteria bacterium]|jgi:3',5'-cyclic AMP phosphodiesterase CpdA|nr:metallophosphoesterase [Ignavibacteria bacterium]MCU7504214.1 metallophosphoesterase [Ignavibacteria bacterium]MCU7516059.1 metallophosphoesterase [Ignavibacteria bacterium]